MEQFIEFVHSAIDCLLSKHSIITHGMTRQHFTVFCVHESDKHSMEMFILDKLFILKKQK